MSTGDWLTLSCIVMLVATAIVHSLLGERRLISPLLAQHQGVLGNDLARFMLRGVWHFMSVLFVVIAAGLWAGLGTTDRTASVLLAATAIGIGGAGIIDAIGTRGRHIGWPMLVLIGLLAAAALATRQ